MNLDDLDHNLTAKSWGHFDDLEQGDTFRVRFDEPGVYPYACTYHPGMTGTVVVGDGTGAGNGAAVVVSSASGEGPSAPAAGASAADETGTPGTGLAGGAIGFVLGLAVAGALARARRHRPAGA